MTPAYGAKGVLMAWTRNPEKTATKEDLSEVNKR